MTVLMNKLMTVKEAAELIGISDSRVRQICINFDIGTKAGGVRFLTESDVEKVRTSKLPMGRPPKKS